MNAIFGGPRPIPLTSTPGRTDHVDVLAYLTRGDLPMIMIGDQGEMTLSDSVSQI